MTFTIQSIGNNVVDLSINFEDENILKNKVQARSNLGAGRSKNQDALSVGINTSKIILCVADGLGCYALSEKSSYKSVLEVPQKIFEGKDLLTSLEEMHQLFIKAYPYTRKGQTPFGEKLNIDFGATTLVVCEIEGNQLKIANVGDSRAMVIRNHQIILQTQDQSMLTFLKMQGEVESNINSHPMKNVLLNALGSPEPYYESFDRGKTIQRKTGQPDFYNCQLQEGDLVFLATDGFYSNITDAELIHIFENNSWDNYDFCLHQMMQQIFKKNQKGDLNPAVLDNYTYLVYRH